MCELLGVSSRQPTRLTISLELLVAHNGHLPGIAHNRSFTLGRFNPVGKTDSEHAFCALMDRLQALWHPSLEPPTIEQRRALISAFAADLRELAPANFLYSDGQALFAHGHRRIQRASGKVEPPGLYILSRQCRPEVDAFEAVGLALGGPLRFTAV